MCFTCSKPGTDACMVLGMVQSRHLPICLPSLFDCLFSARFLSCFTLCLFLRLFCLFSLLVFCSFLFLLLFQFFFNKSVCFISPSFPFLFSLVCCVLCAISVAVYLDAGIVDHPLHCPAVNRCQPLFTITNH